MLNEVSIKLLKAVLPILVALIIMERYLVQPAPPSIAARLAPVDPSRDLRVEIFGIRAQAGSLVPRARRHSTEYGFDRRSCPLSFLRVPAFVGYAPLQRDPPYRPESRVPIRLSLLKTKVGAIIFRCLNSKSVVTDLSRVSPAQPAAKRQALFQVISGFDGALDELVLFDGVQSLHIPVAIVAEISAIAGTESEPA